jgi:hypothetical protein
MFVFSLCGKDTVLEEFVDHISIFPLKVYKQKYVPYYYNNFNTLEALLISPVPFKRQEERDRLKRGREYETD